LINPKIVLLYICDANEEHANSIKEKYALKATVLGINKFDVAFQDENVLGVIVGTPTGKQKAYYIS